MVRESVMGTKQSAYSPHKPKNTTYRSPPSSFLHNYSLLLAQPAVLLQYL